MLDTEAIRKKAEADIKSAMGYDVIEMSFYVDSQNAILEILDELEWTRAAAKELRDWIKTLTSYLKMDSPEKPLVLSDITEVVQETKWLEELG